MRVALTVILLAATFAVTHPFVATADAANECPVPDGVSYSADDIDGVDVEACDLIGEIVTSEVGDLSVAIPEPGEFAAIGLDTEEGSEIPDFIVAVDAVDGEASPSVAPDASEAPPGTTGKCDVTDYSIVTFAGLPTKWTSTPLWYINRSTIPASTIDANNAVAAIRNGVQNHTGSVNNCNMADQMDLGASYQGDTSRFAQISSDAQTCYSADPASVVSFQNLTQKPGEATNSLLGVRCYWGTVMSTYFKITEADIAFDNSSRDWTTNVGSSCTNAYDLESVATHEIGHFWGLAHVTPSVLVMYKSISRCTTAKRSLGRGDVLGLRQHY